MPWMGSWIMIIPSDFIHKALNRPFEDVQSSTSPGTLFSSCWVRLGTNTSALMVLCIFLNDPEAPSTCSLHRAG